MLEGQTCLFRVMDDDEIVSFVQNHAGVRFKQNVLIGDQFEFYIWNNDYSTKNCRAEINKEYSGIEDMDINPETFLAGSKQCKLKEIHVYQIQKNEPDSIEPGQP